MKKQILILEDDRDLAEGITLSLQSDELEFYQCYTIKEAKNLVQNRKFDLLILDINLPDGSGLDFCREVKPILNIPIALLTAKDMEIDIVTGLENGADDYITKPFSLMVLRARIRALLRRNEGEQCKTYKDQIFEFSFDSMEFYKNHQMIDFSKTEQKILYLLVSNPERVITRERILDWVWAEGSEYVEDNAISVSVRRLREKLEDDPKNPKYIETIYGKGYKWKCFHTEEK